MFEQIVTWTHKQFSERAEGLFAQDEIFALACSMYDVYNDDPDFWGNQPLWKLHDNAVNR